MTNIKIWCPKCKDELTESHYESVFKILKDRTWYYCRNCGFEIETKLYWSGINGV